jgi:hypothetical protein
MAESIDLDVKNLVQNEVTITVKLRRMRQFQLRLWIAKKLIYLAQAISWIHFEIEQGPSSLEDAIKCFGDMGIVISIAYGPMKDNRNGWSVDCLCHKTKDSFERPFKANSLNHCLEIANIEIAKRGWLEEKSEV